MDTFSLVQAKGVYYSLSQLVPCDSHSIFKDAYAMTLYLSPCDCHRIYMPFSGVLTQLHYVPGALRPVRSPWTDHFSSLYAQNERVIAIFENAYFHVCMVMVAALNVGHIRLDGLDLTSDMLSNQSSRFFDKQNSFNQGQHFATFLLGSTVILIVKEKASSPSVLVSDNDKVTLGQPLISLV